MGHSTIDQLIKIYDSKYIDIDTASAAVSSKQMHECIHTYVRQARGFGMAVSCVLIHFRYVFSLACANQPISNITKDFYSEMF